MVRDRIIVRRRSRQARQHRRFGDRELVHVLVEIGARRRRHAIGVPAEEDLVEIEFEDLLLRQRRLDPPGQEGLADLAGHRIFVAREEDLGDLLGDGRSAMGALAASGLRDIVPHRAEQARIIDAAMTEEGAVLRRQEGIDQLGRKFVIGELHPPLPCEALHGRAVDVADIGRQRRLIVKQRIGRRQAAREQQPQDEIGDERKRDDHREKLHPALAPGIGEGGSQIRKPPRRAAEGDTLGNLIVHREERLAQPDRSVKPPRPQPAMRRNRRAKWASIARRMPVAICCRPSAELM